MNAQQLPPDAVAGANSTLSVFIAVVAVIIIILFISGGPRSGGRRGNRR